MGVPIYSGRQPSRNLLVHDYEEIADFIATRIRHDRVGYTVHVGDDGKVWITRCDRQRVNELPEAWKIGEYPYTGLRVEYIEDDLLAMARELKARKLAA